MEDWLDQLRKTMHQSGGYKLPRSYILRSLITVAMQLNVDVTSVRSENELTKRIEAAIKWQGKGR